MYENELFTKKLELYKQKLEETKNIIVETTEKILDRGGALDDIVYMSDKLVLESREYENVTRKLKQRQQEEGRWVNKPLCIICVVVFLMMLLVFLS
jgi:hypothetical protein